MAEKVDQDVREAAANTYWQVTTAGVASRGLMQAMLEGKCDEGVWIQAFARMKEAGRQQGLREAAEVALSHMTCGCDGKHGYCNADSPPKAIAAAITALMEGEGKK